MDQRLSPYSAIQEFEVFLKDKDEWYPNGNLGFKINEKFVINKNKIERVKGYYT